MRMRHQSASGGNPGYDGYERRSRSRGGGRWTAVAMVVLLVTGIAGFGYLKNGSHSLTSMSEISLIRSAPGGGGVAGVVDPNAPVQQTRYGPLTAADKDFLVKVRLAGLWEGQSGRKAQERTASPLVKLAGQHLIQGHTDLDAKDIAIAREFGVELPVEPNKDQTSWLNEMDDAKTPSDFDSVFANRLRAAHGKVYALLANIRAGTRNTMIRAFAQYCMTTVLDHITVLERTGRVNFNQLDRPPAPQDASKADLQQVTSTEFGPLTAADRDMLVRVRLAGLWEKPSGVQAQQRSADPLVKTAGQHLIQGHTDLDAKDIAIAKQFNVTLPAEPNADQKSWMAEMTAAQSPGEYDAVFANRLRAAHGKVFALLAKMRAGSQNAMIRTFAQYCMNTVLDHMTVLEKTEKVDFNRIPEPPKPVLAASTAANKHVNLVLLIVMLGVAAVISVVVLRELYGRRSGPQS
jgi:putative membrane protein